MNIALLTGEVTGDYMPRTQNDNSSKYYKLTLKVVDGNFVSYYIVTFLGKLCEKAIQEIKLGNKIFVEGKINKKMFTKKNGEKDCSVELLCNYYEILENTNHSSVINTEPIFENNSQNFDFDESNLPF